MAFFGAVYAAAAAQEPPAEKKKPYEEPVQVAEGVWFEQPDGTVAFHPLPPRAGQS